MKLKLSKGYIANVDDNDPKKPWRFKWTAQVEDKTVYAYRFFWSHNVPTKVFLHRFLLGVTSSNTEVDHKDGNGLNCKRKNLRKATSSQNKCNQGLSTVNTSGVKGVSWDKSKRKWQVQIGLHGKNMHLGRYTNLKEAQHARILAEKKYFKDFVRSSF